MAIVRRVGLLLAVCVGLAGCESTQSTPAAPALEGNVLSDPSLGFRGTRLTLPADYQPFTPLPRAAAAPESAQWAWRMASDYDAAPGFRLLHQFAFGTEDNRGVSVAIMQSVMMHYVSDDDLMWERDVARFFAAFTGSTHHNIDFRTTRKIGSYHVAQVGRPVEGRYNAVAMVMVPPGRLVVLTGFASADQRAQLLADLEAVATSFRSLK